MDVYVLPENFGLARAHEAFHDDGRPKDDKVRERLEGLGKSLAEFLKKLKG